MATRVGMGAKNSQKTDNEEEKKLKAKIEKLKKENADLKEENTDLKAKIAEMEKNNK